MTYNTTPVVIRLGIEDHQLHPYTTVMKWRKLAVPITIDGAEISRYQAPSVFEYIDLMTGEIIKAASLKNDPRVPPQIHVGEITLLRMALMNSLRKEVRAFAFFILQFRNNRRGITPGIDTLVDWYGRIHNKRAANIRRYVTVLQGAGFLAGDSLLSPLFQRTGKNVTTKEHLGEDVAARARFLAIRMKDLSVFQRNTI